MKEINLKKVFNDVMVSSDDAAMSLKTFADIVSKTKICVEGDVPTVKKVKKKRSFKKWFNTWVNPKEDQVSVFSYVDNNIELNAHMKTRADKKQVQKIMSIIFSDVDDTLDIGLTD